MKFAIQINSAPWRSEACETAYQFIRAALDLGHEILRVFFYYDGVFNGLRWIRIAEDERHEVRRWTELAAIHGIDLVICISAAQKRGLLENTEESAGKLEQGLAGGFRIAGLGLWVEACINADRFLEFGD